MKVESREDLELIYRLFDGQKSTRRHSPPNYRDVAQKAWETVFVHDEISPGFSTLSVLTACRELNKGNKTSYPFVSPKYMDCEIKAKNNPYLPTVGVELEIPYSIDLDEKIGSYALLSRVGFPGGQENCSWEFSLPYSYSWTTQALLLHTLLDLEYIPFDQSNITPGWPGRKIPYVDYYSLHYNLGIPKGISIHSKPYYETEFQIDANYLSIACGLAFSTPGRLLQRKSSEAVTVYKEATRSDKTKNSTSNFRLEIKTLGFGHGFSYRQLALIQEVASAFFAYHQPEDSKDIISDERQLALRILWSQARTDLKSLISSEVIELFEDKRDKSRDRFRDILENTELKYKTLKYLCRLAKVARNIMPKNSSLAQHFPNP